MKQQLRGQDGKQLCYLTSVIVSSAVNRSQSRDAFVTPTAAMTTNSRSANANGKDASNGERVPRLCIAPFPKAS